jgi:hypothetical protein
LEARAGPLPASEWRRLSESFAQGPRNQRVVRVTHPISERNGRHVKAFSLRGPRLVVMLAALFLTCLAPATFAAEPAAAPPPKLREETAQAFDRYVELTDAQNEAELKAGSSFFWVDRLPAVEREQAYAALKRGEVKMKKLDTRDNGTEIECPHGLIHHWTGVAFVPGATLDQVLAELEDYDHHVEYYSSDIERSKTESRDGDHFRIYYRIRRHKIVTVVLDTEFDVQYFRDAPGRAHSRGTSVRIAQVENAGKSNEREKPPGDDDGYMWRVETWWRMQERDGGVYVQSEVASLTRDIPAGLGWLIGPFVNSVPKESLTSTLEATRRAVQKKFMK